MIRVKNTEFITFSEEHFTMQGFSSTVSFSPSFSFYASGDLVEAAVRVVRESESYYSVKVDGNDDAEFEFETLPLSEESLFHFPTMTTTFFNRSSDDGAVATDQITSKNIFYGGWNIVPSLSSSSQSHSSSESDESENISPNRCFWSPIRSPGRGNSSKSKSLSEPRRCLLKDLMRRSHSDGAVSTSNTTKRCSFKNLLRRSHSDGSSISPSGNGSAAVKGKNKTASYKPEVDRRRKSYLPYRQDLIGVFAGMSRFRN